MPLVGLGIFGPLIAATVLTGRAGGWKAIRALYAPLLRWRVHPGWYLAAALLPATLLTGLLLLLNAAGRQGPIGYFPAASAVVLAIVVSIAEEVGWRGYALPRLQARYGAFAASVFIGVLWYLWHLPMFAGQGIPLNLAVVMLLFFTGGSLFYTWIYNGSGGSLLLAVFAHVGSHLNNSHRALPGEVMPLVVHAIVYASLGLAFMGGSLAARRRKVQSERANTPASPAESTPPPKQGPGWLCRFTARA
jgi:membrane protease YdiL (CAAX protease family)